MIKVVHTADLHLDRDFFSEDQRLNDLRRQERRALFANLMMYARDRKVDVLLFCGDLFEGLMPQRETAELILREFENTPETQIVIAPGAHDPFRPGSFYSTAKFPANVHIFKEEALGAIALDGLNTTVYGYAHGGRKLRIDPFATPITPDKERINLLLAPGMEEGQLQKAVATGVDYGALGLGHEAGELLEEQGVYYACAGAPEGGGFEEVGHKGVRILAIEKQEDACIVKSKAVRFSRRHYETLTVNLEGYKNTEELVADLSDSLRSSEYDADTLLKITFTGSVPLNFGVITRGLFDKIAARLYYLCIDDQSTLCFTSNEDAKELKEGFATAAGELAGEELLQEVLKTGLKALEGKSF